MIKLQTFVFNPFSENTYVIWGETTGQGLIIDPGCSNPEEEKELYNFIELNKIEPKYLINTHCHIDHILGNAFIKKNYTVEFLAAEEDVFLINLFEEQTAMFGLKAKKSPLPDNYLSEDLDLDLKDIKVKFLFTPGHSPGSYCLYFPENKICFTGDVLFKNAIGRTDLWGGDYETLITSIQQKLLTLPEDVKIYPGHVEPSFIGFEKSNNRYLL